MASKFQLKAVCDERVKALREKVHETHKDVKDIKSNCIPHLHKKIDRQTIIIIVVAILAGVNVLNIVMGMI